MAIVYRVETPEGFGPYSKIAPRFESAEAHHLSPRSEGLKFPSFYYFGFLELSRLTLWFSGKEIEALSEYGEHWLLSRYEVSSEHMVKSATQVAFHRNSSELTGCLPLELLSGSSRRELSAEQVLELQQSFEPRQECLPFPQHSSFSRKDTHEFSGDGELTVNGELLAERLRNLREGSYYRVQGHPGEKGRYFLYRDGALYPLKEWSFEPFSTESAVRPGMLLSAFSLREHYPQSQARLSSVALSKSAT